MTPSASNSRSRSIGNTTLMSRCIAVRSNPMLVWLCTRSSAEAFEEITRKPGSSRTNGWSARSCNPAEVTSATRAEASVTGPASGLLSYSATG